MAGEPESAQQEPGEEPLRKRIPRHIAWWIAALSGIAGIVGAYFAIRPPPPEPATLESWAAEANTICDEEAGDRHDKLRAAWDNYYAALNAWRAGNWAPQHFAQAGTLFLSAAGSYLEVRGKIAKIKQPTDHASDIRDILASLDKLQGNVSGIGSNLRSASGATDNATVNKYLAQAKEQEKGSHAAGLEATGLLRKLGADRCAGTWQ
ncbi:hypothetical protein [Streptomyces chryseus]|uniref:Uncharacterized protein n=1 Tax=Streptomyces chryseus TaxID=68186 RepID=A0ABQ3EBQ8_9ACTN|nr:hypothetical protein [Streptomyces chryseus]GHB31319.1 hypothetical protein GCM10010346_63380 [Streptomyces chryseus]